MFDIQTKSPLSYEGESNNWVYFDDLQVTHTKTRVLQYNEYYPFGLQTSTSWTREGHSNDFLYNDGSELEQASGWYERWEGSKLLITILETILCKERIARNRIFQNDIQTLEGLSLV